MRQMLVVIAAAAAGFVGGVVASRMDRAWSSSGHDQIIRARAFELVDSSGRVRSFWGMDRANNTVLAFSREPNSNRPLSDIREPANQLLSVGVFAGESPSLTLRAANGNTRAELYSSSMFEKPHLLMADDSGPRVSLGIEQSDTPSLDDNDWSLRFEPGRARIGMAARRIDGQLYVRGGVTVSNDAVRYPYDQPVQKK